MATRKLPKVRQTMLVVTLPAKRLKDADGRVLQLPARQVRMSAEMAANHRATAELIGKLKDGHGLSIADLERYATDPPMTGLRLLNIILALQDLKAAEWENAKRVVALAKTHAARDASVRARVTDQRTGRDWRELAREIHAGNDPATGEPWRTEKHVKGYIGERFNRSRRAVDRALSGCFASFSTQSRGF